MPIPRSRSRRPAWLLLVTLLMSVSGCDTDDNPVGNEDPFIPEDPEDNPDQPQFKAVMIGINGAGKEVFRFYRWFPQGVDEVTGQPQGMWSSLNHPFPGFFDGAGAAATSSAPSGAPAAQAAGFDAGVGVFAGGRGDSGPDVVSLAYLYDLSTEAFTVASIQQARADHEMTTLDDGRILITGGFGGPGGTTPLRSAEIFDPTTRTSTQVGDMHQARGFHSAALLDDGRVFVSGAVFDDTEGWINTTEIFDPAANEFTLVAPESTTRWDRHASVALEDGSVLLAGGHESVRSEVFDPDSGTFSPVGDLATVHGFGLTATLLLDGRVLVAGGVESFGNVPSDVAEVFDPETGEWTTVAPMVAARRNHTAVLMPEGFVTIMGGQNEDDGSLDTTELFNPEANRFETGPDLPGEMVGGAAVYLTAEVSGDA